MITSTHFLPRSVACGKGRPPTSLRPKVLNRPGFISICRLLIRLFWPLSTTTKNRNGRSSFKKVFLLDFANCYYSSYLIRHSENDKNIKISLLILTYQFLEIKLAFPFRTCLFLERYIPKFSSSDVSISTIPDFANPSRLASKWRFGCSPYLHQQASTLSLIDACYRDLLTPCTVHELDSFNVKVQEDPQISAVQSWNPYFLKPAPPSTLHLPYLQ